MQSNTTETLIGIVVVVILGAVLFLTYNAGGHATTSGYDIKASFASVDGVNPGTDVRLNGIKIGSVTSMDLDPKTYRAVLHLTINNDVPIPDDSSIKITSAGLLGTPYLAVVPGGDEKMLAAGGTITNTQGSIDFVSLLFRFINGK